MSNTPPTSLTINELAEILFCSGLQASDRPSPEQVRAAVADTLAARGGDGACAATVAQEAGDHPETYRTRMRWALAAVSEAYRVSEVCRVSDEHSVSDEHRVSDAHRNDFTTAA